MIVSIALILILVGAVATAVLKTRNLDDPG